MQDAFEGETKEKEKCEAGDEKSKSKFVSAVLRLHIPQVNRIPKKFKIDSTLNLKRRGI